MTENNPRMALIYCRNCIFIDSLIVIEFVQFWVFVLCIFISINVQYNKSRFITLLTVKQINLKQTIKIRFVLLTRNSFFIVDQR